MKRLLLVFTALLILALAALWHARQPLLFWANDWLHSQRLALDPRPQPDAERYHILCAEAKIWRTALAARYQTAKTPEQKAAIEQEARILLESLLPSLMRCWIGTAWDFNGTASSPGNGKIACGYFVSTVLKDAGFQVNRYRLAQQPSSRIIHTFIEETDCTLSVGANYDAFCSALAEKPTGIYIVGLDTHVAFLINHPSGFHFIHSSGSRPWQVVDETHETASVLETSNWRMLGNLTASPRAIRAWLKGTKIPVKQS